MTAGDDIEQTNTTMLALLSRLHQEARAWPQLPPDEPPQFDLVRAGGVHVRVKWQDQPGLGYWRTEAGRYVFSANLEGSPEIVVDAQGEAVAHTRALCVRRGELEETEAGPEVHSLPPGLSFPMFDERTRETVWVFVTAAALHGVLDGNSGPPDQFHGKDVLARHRKRIERVASRKYAEQGALGELEGLPALWVQASDLERTLT